MTIQLSNKNGNGEGQPLTALHELIARGCERYELCMFG